jgi:uncharacterized protein YecE (DUF72 family)
MTETATIRIGASGYSYKDWNGPFYPEKTRQEEMLPFYATQFDTTELNFSYYRLPTARQLGRMAEVAGEANPRFTFSVKAFKGLTHEIAPSWKDDAKALRDALAPLREADRLAAVLVQFPHSFHYTVQNRRHLDALLQMLEGLPVACEFRSQEWLAERVYQGLRARNVALVAVDEPDLDGLLPRVAVPTADFGYLRFHGRNRENWWHGDNASRYDYLYSEEELREWLPRIERLAESARQLVIYFNNHWRGQATENAVDLRKLLNADD